MLQELYSGTILIGGLACLLHVGYCTFTRGKEDFHKVAPWKGPWTDIAILIWAVLMCIWLFSGVAYWLIDILKPGDSLDDAISMGISGVLTAIAFMTAAGLTRVFTGHFLGGKLNTSPWNLQHALPFAFYLLMASLLPVIWVNAGWTGILEWVNSMGYDIDISNQPIVEAVIEAHSPWSPLLVCFAAVFLAPVGEELVFRGGVYRFLKERWGPIVGSTVSAALFALIHQHLAVFMPLFFLGLALVYAYERSGNILVPIVFHSMFNLNSVIILLFMEHFDSALP